MAELVTPASDSPQPDTYRGWAVTWDYGHFTATGPDYDASWEGEEDGWVDNGHRLTARTRADLEAEVDAWFEDHIEQFFSPPFTLVEPEGNGAAMIVDADGKSVAMMMWPGHPPEETEAAEQATYALGRVFAKAGEAA